METHNSESYSLPFHSSPPRYSLFHGLPAPVCYLDTDLHYQYANPSYEKWLGVLSGSLAGQPAWSPAGAAFTRRKEHLEAALKGETVRFETRLPLPADEQKQVCIEVSITPDYDLPGRVCGCLVFINDVTERETLLEELERKSRENDQALHTREAELQKLNASLEKRVAERTRDLQQKNALLQESEERYHRMIEEVEDYAILLLDKDGIIRNWNKGAEKIKGYQEQEIVGKHFRIFYRREDQERRLPEQLIQEAARTGRATHEGWRVRKDGSIFWGSTVITALHDQYRNVIGFSKLTRDLTERKLAEDKLKQYASDLEIQNKELEQFTYVASHDMKEPLRKIILYNNLLVEKLPPLIGPKEQNYLERSISAAQRMQRLIDDLLTYSRASVHSDNYELIDLNATVSDVVDLYDEKLKEAEGSITVGPLPVIRGVAFQIRQLFDNLISNAIKYRSPGRGLHIQVSSERLEELFLKEGNLKNGNSYYKISVADNGMGFEADYSQKIFELFQRLVTQSEYTGTGIGLSICKKIVQNHKGYIEASGRENEGAVFDIYLPVGTTIL